MVTQQRIPLPDRLLVNNSLSLAQHQTWEQVIMQQLILDISHKELLNWIIQEAVVLNKIASTTLWIKVTRVELVVLFLQPFLNWKRINNLQHLASLSVQDLLYLLSVVQQMQIPTQEDLHFYNSTKEIVEKCLPCLVEQLSRIDLLSSRQTYQPWAQIAACCLWRGQRSAQNAAAWQRLAMSLQHLAPWQAPMLQL